MKHHVLPNASSGASVGGARKSSAERRGTDMFGRSLDGNVTLMGQRRSAKLYLFVGEYDGMRSAAGVNGLWTGATNMHNTCCFLSIPPQVGRRFEPANILKRSHEYDL